MRNNSYLEKSWALLVHVFAGAFVYLAILQVAFGVAWFTDWELARLSHSPPPIARIAPAALEVMDTLLFLIWLARTTFTFIVKGFED